MPAKRARNCFKFEKGCGVIPGMVLRNDIWQGIILCGFFLHTYSRVHAALHVLKCGCICIHAALFDVKT